MSSRVAIASIFCFAALQAQDVSVRVLLGVTDKESTSWEGSVQAEGARIIALEL